MRKKHTDCANFVFEGPNGCIAGYISERGVQSLLLLRPHMPRPSLQRSGPNLGLGRKLEKTLGRYFAGVAVDFSDFPLDLDGATPFQRAVWLAAKEIPWGEVGCYGDLAARIKRPAAARAVGQALGANPIPIIIPCHRVLARGGHLGGFSAGLDWKRELLRLEGHAVD